LILLDLQRQLERIYRLTAQLPIDRFLISAEELAGYLPRGTPVRPQVLFQEAGENVFLAVHVGREELHPKNLADFLGAAEETSHYLYLSFKARNERPVSLLDVEVQGEIDKFLLASLHFSTDRNLFRRLFEEVRFHERLGGEAVERYRRAHGLGAKFLKSLGEIFRRDRARPDVLRMLRTFYRWTSQRRLAGIARL
jgi:hypothetical protein